MVLKQTKNKVYKTFVVDIFYDQVL